MGDGFTGAVGALAGELILNTPKVDATFRQADGLGGIRPLTLDATGDWNSTAVVRSELAGSKFAAPLILTGLTTLGNAGGGGKDFTLSGSIGGIGTWAGTSPNGLTNTYDALVKVGAEKVTLGGANTFTGNTLISNGTLVMANLMAFGDATAGNTVTVDGPTSALTIGVYGAILGGDLGYSIVLQDGEALEVTANGVKLAGAAIGDNTLILSNSMQGGNAPTAPVLGKTILNVPALHSDYALGLSGTICGQPERAGWPGRRQGRHQLPARRGHDADDQRHAITLGQAAQLGRRRRRHGGGQRRRGRASGPDQDRRGKLVLGGAGSDINSLSISPAGAAWSWWAAPPCAGPRDRRGRQPVHGGRRELRIHRGQRGRLGGRDRPVRELQRRRQLRRQLDA